ncbi:MAG TPA: glycosyltransferase family 39 protein [Acidimicrobiales bacterium]|nr:glycosyltransferase family 39 protein [Acidimicrobiales bacterium]
MTRLRLSRDAVLLLSIMGLGLILRLWSIEAGLPSVHNLDEATHFVPMAAEMSGGSLNPHYFQNPPGFTYLLHLAFTLAYALPGRPGTGAIRAAIAGDPTTLFVIGRVLTALTGVAACGFVFAGARVLFDRTVALVAALFLSVAFLPVFYSHLALNDVPALLPLAVGLFGVARITTRGRTLDYAVSGVALGLAAATKYTAAALVVAIVLAWWLRARATDDWRLAVRQLGVAAGASVVAFVVLNPFSVLDADAFIDGVRRQQQLSADVGKVGLDDTTGWQYYLWTLTWGFGVLPIALAVGGGVVAWRRHLRAVAPWLGFSLAAWLFMGAQTRFYARWFLPVYPVLAVLAALGLVALVRVVTPRWRVVAAAGFGVAALAQPLVSVVHNNRVVARTDTRDLAKAWLVANVGRHERVVIELMSSRPFFNEGSARDGDPVFDLYPQPRGNDVERYAFTLRPTTLDAYVSGRYCVVVTASTQRDRAVKAGVRGAVAYYRALERRATRIATFSPMRGGRAVPGFNFDISYNWYRLDYARPGPRVDVYRLRDCAAA